MNNTIDLIDDITKEILEQSNKFDSNLEEDFTKDILEPVELYDYEKEKYTNELNYNSVDEFSIGLFDEIY